ncbi:MAG: hypothetical protein B7X02_01370 [Rhodospirillales bacterium 12-54-5]|nr:MAG: hypothetical protein B7X02_01370 [Rhodospirillales bacterium 12-54-5]
MLVPSNRIFYAIEAVLVIAYHSKSGAVASRDVAERQGLPPRYLEPILQKMVRAGILKSVRGPQGGYILGRERRRITLADIAAVLEPDDALPPAATPLGELILQPTLHTLQTAWKKNMEHITLADLCAKATAANISSETEPHSDFTI